MSDIINTSNETFFQNHNGLRQSTSNINLSKSIEWINHLYDQSQQNQNTSNSTKSSTGYIQNVDGTHSPSNFLNLSSTPVINQNHNINGVHQNLVQFVDHTLEDNTNLYVSPVGSPVPSYYSSSSSPIQDNNYYSPQSPDQPQFRIPQQPQQQQQQQQQPQQQINTLNTTMSISPSNFEVPNFNNDSFNMHNNLVLNFVQNNQPQQQQQLPQQKQQQNNYIQPEMLNFNFQTQIISQQQHQLNLQQPIIQQQLPQQQSLQSQFDEFMEKPFSEESFYNQLKSVVPIPSFKEAMDVLSSSSSLSSDSSQESDGDRKKSNSKKRLRDEDSENFDDEEIDTSGVSILPKDKVLKLTSKEIEEYVSRLKQNHVLTQVEEKELKKQRRLVKNREYASQSRSRRKAYVENIETKLQKTNQENVSMKSQITSIKEENKLLKKQLFTFTATLKTNPSLAEAFGKIFQPTGTSNTKAASLSLFVFFLLFTFAFTFFIPIQPKFYPYSSLQTEKSFLQRNLLAIEPIDSSAFSILYDKTSHLKTVIYEESKLYIEKMFDSLSLMTGSNSKEILDKLNSNNNTMEKQQPETVILSATPQENVQNNNLESLSPPLSPLIESNN